MNLRISAGLKCTLTPGSQVFRESLMAGTMLENANSRLHREEKKNNRFPAFAIFHGVNDATTVDFKLPVLNKQLGK